MGLFLGGGEHPFFLQSEPTLAPVAFLSDGSRASHNNMYEPAVLALSFRVFPVVRRFLHVGQVETYQRQPNLTTRLIVFPPQRRQKQGEGRANKYLER